MVGLHKRNHQSFYVDEVCHLHEVTLRESILHIHQYVLRDACFVYSQFFSFAWLSFGILSLRCEKYKVSFKAEIVITLFVRENVAPTQASASYQNIEKPRLVDGVFLFWWRWAESNRRAIGYLYYFYKG